MFDGVNVIQTHFVFAWKVKKFGENESAYMKLVLRGAASDGIWRQSVTSQLCFFSEEE